jgi:polyhydroxyalkanoate synthesis regulator phasin
MKNLNKEVTMDPKHIAKQMMVFNKTAFDNNFRAMQALQEQTEKLVGKFWEKSPMFPEEGKKAISDWMSSYKKGCDDFKSLVDGNFKKVEDFFKETK